MTCPSKVVRKHLSEKTYNELRNESFELYYRMLALILKMPICYNI